MFNKSNLDNVTILLYVDADSRANSCDRKSISGHIIMLNNLTKEILGSSSIDILFSKIIS